MIKTWRIQDSTAPALAHSLAGVEGPVDRLESDELGSEIEINYPLYRKILRLFKRINSSVGRYKEVDGVIYSTRMYHRHSVVSSDSYPGFSFTISAKEKIKINDKPSTRYLYHIDYSLVPRIMTPKAKRRGILLNRREVSWFLNVGCNSSSVVKCTDLDQVNGFYHRRLGKESSTSERALGLLHTIGYWILEDFQHLLRDPELEFHWPEDFAARLLNHEPFLNEVSFSFLGEQVTCAEAEILFNHLHICYNSIHGYAEEKKRGGRRGRIFSFGDSIGVKLTHKPKVVNKNGVKYNLGKIILHKKYGDAAGDHYKAKLQIEVYTRRRSDGTVPKRRVKFTITFTNRFWERRLTQQEFGNSPFTLDKFIQLCKRNSDKNNIFDKQYDYACKLFRESTYEDFMLPQLLGLVPSEFIRTVKEWAGDNDKKLNLLNNWMMRPQLTPVQDGKPSIVSKALDIPQRTVERYVSELRDLGVDIRFPVALMFLLVDAVLRLHMTPEEVYDLLSTGTNNVYQTFKNAVNGDEKSINRLSKIERDMTWVLGIHKRKPFIADNRVEGFIEHGRIW